MTVTNGDVIRVLIAARDLLAKGWCQKSFATSPKDYIRNALDKDAVNFCVTGAVLRAVVENDMEDVFEKILHHLMKSLDLRQIRDIYGNKFYKEYLKHNPSFILFCWNDDPTRTQKDVVESVTKAIEDLRELPAENVY